MTINRTTLLDLPLPVTGTEAGTWGDVTNNGLTEYLDIAIAGMVSLTSSDFTAGALTISTTEGNSSGTNIANSSAQYATLKVSSLAANSTITAPASARAYRVINADATYTLTVKASGQTGVTFQPGTTGMVAFNGTDYEIVGVVGPASATDNAVARFDGTTGQIVQNSGVTIDDSNNVSGVAQLNATTADLTNIEVTNIKAKDGTAAASIADSTGVFTHSTTTVFPAGAVGTPSITTAGDTNTGIYFPAADTIGFVEGGAEAMRIDSDGNVGLSTNNVNSNFGKGLGYGGNTSATASGYLDPYNGGSGNTLLYNTGAFNIVFGTNNSERMRIDSSGVLLVNRTSLISGITNACKLQVLGAGGDWTTAIQNSQSTTPYGLSITYSGAAPNNTGSEFIYCGDTSLQRFGVRSNGGVANYSANNVNLSDRREKTNFAPAKNYLDTICAIPVQTFNYIDQNMEEDGGLTLGVVAQDVQEVAPELVMESNWGTKEEPKMRLSIYQTDLQYALMKCIQELKSELDSVKAELATLKGN